MPQKRAFERKKRRLLVEFVLDGTHHSGFTFDVSPNGVFVRSSRLPELGKTITVDLHLPQDKRVSVRGKVVRSFRVPAELSRVIPSGFAIQISDCPEEYFQFLASI